MSSTKKHIEEAKIVLKPKANLFLRVGIAELGLKNWQAGAILGQSETVFSRKLSRPMDDREQVEWLERIREGVKGFEK